MERNNFMKKVNSRRNKGFTLIEVIVAVSIVIILATLAVPKVSGYISKAKEAKTMSMGKQIFTAAMWSYTDNGDNFDAAKVKEAVEKTSNVKLSEDPTIAANTITINFISDSKTYALAINGDANNYTITDGSTLVYSSTQ
jgi:type IV pilus assembly protein PilA